MRGITPAPIGLSDVELIHSSFMGDWPVVPHQRMISPMSTETLSHSVKNLGALLHQAQATLGDSTLPGLDGTQIRSIFQQSVDLLGALRNYLATATDPRLALEMSAAAHALAAEATRLKLVAAERATLTAANTLAQAELENLREHPADTTREPQRASGRASYKNSAELLASWNRIPYTVANRQVLDSQDLVARRDLTGTRVAPRFPHLSQRFFQPEHDPEAVRTISEKLARVEPADTTFDGMPSTPTLRHTDGRTLEEHAAKLLEEEFTTGAATKKVQTLISQAANDPKTATTASRRRGLYKLPIRNQHSREYLLCLGALEGGRMDALIAEANNPRTLSGKAARVNPVSSWYQKPAGPADPEAATARDNVPDFLPPGAESARWDDDDDFQPDVATAPERALNALLDLLEFGPEDEQERQPTDSAQTPPLFDLAAGVEEEDGAEPGDGTDPDAGALEQSEASASDTEDQHSASERPEVTGNGAAFGQQNTGSTSGCPPHTEQDIATLTARGDVGNLGNRKLRRTKRNRPQLIAYMYIENLRDIASAHAETQHGVNLPPAALRQLECQADVIPAVLNADGALLDYGRRRRLVPDILQRAVLARDRYCIVPGCTAMVEHLEFHHVIPFSQGGKTELHNIVPACRSHHIELDLELIKVVWRSGLPWVLLPPDRDPQQRLRRNYVPPGLSSKLPLPDTG